MLVGISVVEVEDELPQPTTNALAITTINEAINFFIKIPLYLKVIILYHLY